MDYILPRLNINMAQYSSIFVGYSVSNTIVPLLSGAYMELDTGGGGGGA